ncbi:hypothetical protein GGS24DRAFT_2651 [Hypoxylon argillaceum]|nr:hypothetical protein GGS24DRAFT_2651 [Hypoxylon argillaceum]
MQRFGSSSIFALLPVSTRFQECQIRRGYKKLRLSRPRRKKPPLRKTYPTFEASDLLLDLDAESAEGLRAYDDRIDGRPETRSTARNRKLQPLIRRIADFESQYKESESSAQSIAADKFHPLHITDSDILAVALLDLPNTLATAVKSHSGVDPSSSRADILGTVLNKNGIPHVGQIDTSATITYMLRRRELLPSRLYISGPNDEERFLRVLDNYSTFAELERIITRMTETQKGCQILSRVGDKLYMRLVEGPENKPIRVLSLLNNLLINLDRHGLPVSAKLYELGIWTSLECQAIETTHHYIKRRLDHGHLDDDVIDSILEKLLHTSITSSPFISHEFQSHPSHRLTTVFSLLTGYIPGEDALAVSLGSLMNRKRSRGFQLYSQCLARLGAFRMLWHEWQSADSKVQHTGVGVAQNLPSYEKDHCIITAVLYALDTNPKMTDLANSPGFAAVTGQLQEDCKLDMVAISRSAETLALPMKKLGDHTSTAYTTRWNLFYEIFKIKEMKKAFSTLQSFLIRAASLPRD